MIDWLKPWVVLLSCLVIDKDIINIPDIVLISLEELTDAVLHKQQMSEPLNSGMRSSKPPAYLRSRTAVNECPVHPHWDAEPDALPWFYLDRSYCSPHRDAGPGFFYHTGFKVQHPLYRRFHTMPSSGRSEPLSCQDPSVHLCCLLLVWIVASQVDIHLLCAPNCRWCLHTYTFPSGIKVRMLCSEGLKPQDAAQWDICGWVILSFPSV